MTNVYRDGDAVAQWYAKRDEEERERKAAEEAERAKAEAERKKREAEDYEKRRKATKEHNEFMDRIAGIWGKASAVKSLRFNVETGKSGMVESDSSVHPRAKILAAMRRGDGVIDLPSVVVKGNEIDLIPFTELRGGGLCDGAGVLRELPKYETSIKEISDPPFKIPNGVHIYGLNGGSEGRVYALCDGRLLKCSRQDGSDALNQGEGFKARQQRLAAEEKARKAEEERLRREAEEKAEAERRERNLRELAALPQKQLDKLRRFLAAED